MEKRNEERQAKKDYKKLLKKYGFKKELDEIEDYESFYNSTETLSPEQEVEEDDSFINDRERAFYKDGEDMDFVKYHKRVTRNVHNELQ